MKPSKNLEMQKYGIAGNPVLCLENVQSENNKGWQVLQYWFRKLGNQANGLSFSRASFFCAFCLLLINIDFKLT